MFFRMIYDENLAAATYLVGCQKTRESILIDPERDIDRYLAAAKAEGLRITAVAETHIHADFLSGTREMAEQTGAMVYLSGEGGPDWSYQWLKLKKGGGPYKHELLKDGSLFKVGNIEFKVAHTPGHTPEHIAFLVTDRGSGATEPMGILTGDFLFVGDLGRPDLLESAVGKAGAADESAKVLYRSVQKLKSLPEFLQVWPAHGAGSACGKALGAVPVSTIGYEKRFNPAVRAAGSEKEFADYILAGQPEPPLYFARMKVQNRLGPPLLGSLPEPRAMAAAEITAVDTRKNVLIDTRSWDQYSKGHVAGSLHHPLNRTFATDVGAMVEDDVDIYLVCGPNEVEALVRNLVRVGLDRVKGWINGSELDGGPALIRVKESAPAEVSQKVTSGALRVLDVRRSTEYRGGHIPGAKNIAHTRLAARLSEVPAEKSVLVHCQAGMRASYAYGLLERAGFDVVNLKGGFQEWQKSGGEVEVSSA